MKRIIPALVIITALSGCTAAVTPAAKNTPIATPKPTATTIAEAQTAAAQLPEAQRDALFLAGARSQVKTGTDASLIVLGHKVCTDLAAGVSFPDREQDVVAAGFPIKDSLAIIVSAGIAYCKS